MSLTPLAFALPLLKRIRSACGTQHIGRLEDYPWFYGPISRQDAARILEYEEDGCFLVRTVAGEW